MSLRYVECEDCGIKSLCVEIDCEGGYAVTHKCFDCVLLYLKQFPQERLDSIAKTTNLNPLNINLKG